MEGLTLLKVGKPAPKFRLPKGDSSYVALDDFLGKSNKLSLGVVI
jgi:peroxiredoxin